MTFGDAPIIDKLLFEEIDSLSIENQNIKLRQELEAIICEKYDLVRHIIFLESQISKLANTIT
jgi:hypothetical protein